MGREFRDMVSELEMGINDGSYMVLTPNWTDNLREPPTERMSWPTYARVKRHVPEKNIATTVPGQDNTIFHVPRNHPAF